MVLALLLALMVSEPGPFTLVNGTSTTLERIAGRPSNPGSGEWRGLGPGRLSAGARGAVPALGGEMCAYDIKATAGGATVEWHDVNLCDVRTVVLNRRADGIVWVDYY